MDFLRVEGFKKNFSQTEVLKGIDFTLQKGEILVIIGASGSGKTTLLRCLNYLEPLDKGKVYFNGELLSDAEIRYSDRELRKKRLKFGLVFQNFNLFPQYRVMKNVTIAADLLAREKVCAFRKEESRVGPGSIFTRIRSGNKKARLYSRQLKEENQQRAESLLQQVGMYEKRDCYPHELSGGQQQRIAIARALALEPEVLCFDEPTSALDPNLKTEVLKVIRGLKGRTMIIVTHEMEFARNIADHVLFMANGIVEEQGTPEEVFFHPRKEKTKAFLRREEYS